MSGNGTRNLLKHVLNVGLGVALALGGWFGKTTFESVVAGGQKQAVMEAEFRHLKETVERNRSEVKDALDSLREDIRELKFDIRRQLRRRSEE